MDMKPRRAQRAAAVAVAAGLVGAGVALWRRGRAVLTSQARPAASYDEALLRVAALQAAEGDEVRNECRTELMSHGGRASRAVVLLHGYTSCPRQFHELGRDLYERGYNVLIPRLPYHGLHNLLADEPAGITVAQLVRLTDEVLDIARGLGERVAVAGLSGGGALSVWAAHQRADVDVAVPIAPSLGVAGYPAWITATLARVLLRTPNQFVWWSPELRERLPAAPYSYPRFGTRGLAALIAIGAAVSGAARRLPPAARKIVLVTNGAEPAVSNVAVAALGQAWRARGATVETYEFDAALSLPHDLVDPRSPGARVDLVHPTLVRLIAGDGGKET
ncbi:MAG: hypothetical protein RLZZ387_5336 [Chloroflexota bacterium]|jgi:carboxylesterase